MKLYFKLILLITPLIVIPSIIVTNLIRTHLISQTQASFNLQANSLIQKISIQIENSIQYGPQFPISTSVTKMDISFF